jgi:hypothetical protein
VGYSGTFTFVNITPTDRAGAEPCMLWHPHWCPVAHHPPLAAGLCFALLGALRSLCRVFPSSLEPIPGVRSALRGFYVALVTRFLQ